MTCEGCKTTYRYIIACPQCLARWLVDSHSQQRDLNRAFLDQYQQDHGKEAADVVRNAANALRNLRALEAGTATNG